MTRKVQSIFDSLKRFYYTKNFWIERGLKKREKKQQNYNCFLVLDFEATCQKDKEIHPQEIIEVPCIKIDSETCEIEDVFHHYVKPKAHPVLTSFCTELTGISQEMVKNQPVFEEVFKNFQLWLKETQAWSSSSRSIFVTCGDWDLKVMLPNQCQHLGIEIPPEFSHWINLKKAYCAATGYFPRGIMDMLAKQKLPCEGRLHSGIDDCRNIVAIMKSLLANGYIFEETSSPADPKFRIQPCNIYPSNEYNK